MELKSISRDHLLRLFTYREEIYEDRGNYTEITYNLSTCYGRYGSLITADSIEDAFKKCEEFIKENNQRGHAAFCDINLRVYNKKSGYWESQFNATLKSFTVKDKWNELGYAIVDENKVNEINYIITVWEKK